KPLAPERLEEWQIQAREVTDVAEAAFHFVVNHGLGEERARVCGGDTDGGLAFGGNGRRELLIEQAGKDHDGSIARFAVRNAQAADEFAFNGHALERGGEKPAAAVHD